MAQNLTPDRQRVSLAVLAAIATLAWPTGLAQVLIIVAAGLLYHRMSLTGFQGLAASPQQTFVPMHVPISRRLAVSAWVLFVGLLVGLPLLRYLASSQPLAVFDSFFRVGSLVFGGGHVVLPLIQAEVVPPGWITNEQFIAGYGAAQAVPGPLFTFAAYLGAVIHPWPNGWVGAALALGAIFLPSILLIIGALPLWNRLRACQLPSDAARHQCRGGRVVAGSALSSGVDERDPCARRFCPRDGGFSAVGVLEVASLAGRGAISACGCRHRASVNHAT
jgi:chromate transporter